MERAAILALFDDEQRRNVDIPGMRREATPIVVRYVGEREPHSAVLYSRLDPARVAAAIAEQVAYFAALGHKFEWKVYEHDMPPDLRERLAAAGFTVEEAEAVMVLDLEDAPARLLAPVTVPIRRLTDPTALQDVVTVESEVWGSDCAWLAAMLSFELQHDPTRMSIFVADIDGRPACAAWLRYHPPGQFASLWGGSTRAPLRGRGLYTALLAARAQEAQARGVRFLTVDAGPLSRPILERLGFCRISTAWACNWALPGDHR